jgi:hypothetical protein
MSNAEPTAQQQRVIGRPYRPGESGNPAGRPRGSRNRLADQFIFDLHNSWIEHGVDALARCARDEPGVYVRVIAGLMPRDIGISVTATVDAVDFAQNFRAALALLGNEPTSPTMKTIIHKATTR